eukprot:3683294-Amphidinium_carterae.1
MHMSRGQQPCKHRRIGSTELVVQDLEMAEAQLWSYAIESWPEVIRYPRQSHLELQTALALGSDDSQGSEDV